MSYDDIIRFLIVFIIMWFSSGFVMGIIVYLWDSKIKDATNKDLALLAMGTFMGFITVVAGIWAILSGWMDTGKTKYLFKKNEN